MDVNYDSFLNRYKMYLLDQKGLAQQTYRAYINDIEHMLAFLEEKQVDIPQRHVVRSYMSKLHNKYSRTTINRKLSSIKGFFDFVMTISDLEANPFSHVRSIKNSEILPKFLTPEEMIDLIEGTEDPRDRALLELLYSTGIRVGEVETMNCMDIEKGIE